MSTSNALALKANAQVAYTGNDLGGSLNIQVRDIGINGTSTTALSPSLKSGLAVTKGTLSYTSINQLKSAQTFVTADYDGTRVTMIFTIQNAIVGVFVAKQGTFTSAFAPTATWVKFNAYTDNRDALTIIKGIETLGGLEGYEKHVATSRALSVPQSIIADADGWNTTGINVSFGSALIYSWFSANTLDGHSGSGSSWGVGLGGGDVTGVLHYSSWDKLTSANNDFSVAAGGEEAGGVVFYFDIDGENVAWIAAAGEVVGALVGFSGSWDWN